MDGGRELIEALSQVANEKRIDKELIFEAIEVSLVSACKKHFGQNSNVRVTVDRENGQYTVLAQKNVVETAGDTSTEVSLEDARKINNQCELGDTIEMVVTPKNFGRISAQTAKQVVVQKFREAEREILYNEFVSRQHEVLTAIVQRRDRRTVIVDLGRIEGTISQSEQIPRESYQFQDRIKVYITEVKQSNKGPLVLVSRTHPELLKKLFEQEVPEIYDGIVEIKSVARDAGVRSKVAVYTSHPHVDPIGACVGQGGSRVNLISRELCGEKLDIILWNEDPAKFIAAALSPSKVVDVAVNISETAARVVVPDHQLSLAIGKEGQNARLAARLTGWRIDIKSESQAAGTDFLIFPEVKQKIESEPEEILDSAQLEEAYSEYYDEEYYDDEYSDEEYYYNDDEYYDDEDEYYDEEYYDSDEYYDETPEETPVENVEVEPEPNT